MPNRDLLLHSETFSVAQSSVSKSFLSAGLGFVAMFGACAFSAGDLFEMMCKALFCAVLVFSFVCRAICELLIVLPELMLAGVASIVSSYRERAGRVVPAAGSSSMDQETVGVGVGVAAESDRIVSVGVSGEVR